MDVFLILVFLIGVPAVSLTAVVLVTNSLIKSRGKKFLLKHPEAVRMYSEKLARGSVMFSLNKIHKGKYAYFYDGGGRGKGEYFCYLASHTTLSCSGSTTTE